MWLKNKFRQTITIENREYYYANCGEVGKSRCTHTIDRQRYSEHRQLVSFTFYEHWTKCGSNSCDCIEIFVDRLLEIDICFYYEFRGTVASQKFTFSNTRAGEKKIYPRMTVHLTRIETVIYFGVYIFALAYGFYNAYLVGTGESRPKHRQCASI